MKSRVFSYEQNAKRTNCHFNKGKLKIRRSEAMGKKETEAKQTQRRTTIILLYKKTLFEVKYCTVKRYVKIKKIFFVFFF